MELSVEEQVELDGVRADIRGPLSELVARLADNELRGQFVINMGEWSEDGEAEFVDGILQSQVVPVEVREDGYREIAFPSDFGRRIKASDDPESDFDNWVEVTLVGVMPSGKLVAVFGTGGIYEGLTFTFATGRIKD